jgi:hypothetical protein
MVLRFGAQRLRDEIRTMRAEIERARPRVMLIEIIGDPEPDDTATVGGVCFVREAGEDRAAFIARLMATAERMKPRREGQPIIVAIGAEEAEPSPTLADLKVDGQRVEISGAPERRRAGDSEDGP